MINEVELDDACRGYNSKAYLGEDESRLYLVRTAKRLGVDKDWLYTQIKKRGGVL